MDNDVTPLVQAQHLATTVLDQVETVVIGKRPQLTLALAGILAGGHVLIQDVPGVGKTLAARALAQTLGLGFRRAQFTPDLLPSDLTGSLVYDPGRSDFVFRPGPVFTGFLLADEINRTPPKTQSALLEAMAEHQVSVNGQTYPLPEPFHVMATANPIEQDGTYNLPEAQLDRFLLRLDWGYPTREQEWQVVSGSARSASDVHLDAVTDAAGLIAAQKACQSVHVSDDLGLYVIDLVTATRKHPDVAAGASPRGSIAVVDTARALALMDGRDYATPADVQAIAHPALDHRVVLRPDRWLSDASGRAVVQQALDSVPVPDAA